MSSKFRVTHEKSSEDEREIPEGGSNVQISSSPLFLPLRERGGTMSVASTHAILNLDDVGFTYSHDREFINHLSFSLEEGEFIGLLGANGSGKSTILKLASGILTPSAGLITLWNKPLQSFKNKDRAKLLCYLPQLLDIQVPFRVRDLAGMGFYPYDILPVTTIEDALETVGLRDKSDYLITNLSGGEKRRTFIAMTLLQGAGILLLDEPLANLDIKYQIEIFRLLNHLREEKGISIIMALHDINIALQFEKVIVLKEGRILGLGSPENVLTEAMFKEAFDLEMAVQRDISGKAYVSYENNFFKENHR
ncbi:MAG: ABC transporter ATP-binding protein [Thermodesulfovibrionales bacterium]|nr:ABC transporter ATP-binding protein [Thermodesulfovibrionales bacterium]